jgi:hypothetical protein
VRTHRKFPRVSCCAKIDLTFAGRSYQGHLENLSLNGALVNLDGEIGLPPGQPCLLFIHLEEGLAPLPPLQLWAETVHGCATLVGMRFQGYDEQVRDKLLHLMKCQASEPTKLKDGLKRIQGYLADYHSGP